MKNIFKNLALLIATISFTTMAASPVNALYDPNSPNGSACPNLEEGMMCITQAPAEPAVPNNRLAVLLRLVIHADISVNAKIELIKILLRPSASQDDITTVDSDEIDQKADDESDKPRRPESSASNVVDSSESRDGLASFRLSFDLRSFGNDNYISSNLAESFDFEILDGSFDVVATNIDLDQGELGGFVQSDARRTSGYFTINEDRSEEFEVSVTYRPAVDGFYYLRLTRVNYNNQPQDPNASHNLNRNQFESKAIYVSAD